jgi:hypothetical protein
VKDDGLAVPLIAFGALGAFTVASLLRPRKAIAAPSGATKHEQRFIGAARGDQRGADATDRDCASDRARAPLQLQPAAAIECPRRGV